jgi:iron complex transport system ATP-binding protein
MSSVMEIKELSFEIEGRRILQDINLSIAKGEFVGLIGPNGAGKTTLLKCINGINSHSGTIEIEGLIPGRSKSKDIAQKVSLMHQNTGISFPFPSLDIVLMGRYPYIKRMKGETGKDYASARKYMDYTDTRMFEDKPVTELSGGERQRVLFAKVLAQESDIILLDEPTASLDITHQEQIFKYSKELAENGNTVVAAIHDLKIAAKYCSRLILMQNGCVMADGSPEEVLTRENMSKVFEINAFVYRNRVTGLLDFHIYRNEGIHDGKKVHIIGGGGSASMIIRQLFEEGFGISAGVFAAEDSDRQSAEIFGAEYIATRPFCDIGQELLQKNIEAIKKSDVTILCNMPFGKQNLKNLEAAEQADNLIIIEDDPPESRDFTGGSALEIYRRIRERAIVTSSARLHEVI